VQNGSLYALGPLSCLSVCLSVCLYMSVCLSCPVLSCTFVTLVCCGQTAGCIKISLGKEVELGPGHI